MKRAAIALLAWAGCKAPDVAPVEPAVVDAPKPSVKSSPMPAFIVIRRETTDIVPVDPDRGLFDRRGMWTMQTTDLGPQIGGLFVANLETDLDVEGIDAVMPVCPGSEVTGGCWAEDYKEAYGQVAIDPRGTLRMGVAPADYGACDCFIVDHLSTDEVLEDDEPEPLDPEELATSIYSDEEYREYCMDDEIVAPPPVSVVGANLYRLDLWDNMACSGVHVLDLMVDVTPLIPGADPVPLPTSGDAPYCNTDFDEPNIDWLADYDSHCRLEGEGCDSCYHDAEIDMFAIRRGNLFHVTGSASAAGGQCTCASPRELSPDRCPSPLDPCGDPSGFEGVARAPYFWIETQGRWALAGDDDTLVLRSKDGVLDDGIMGGADVLGVHFVEDARPLVTLEWKTPETIGLDVPKLDPQDEKSDGDAKAWGNRCFGHFKAERLDAAEAACMRGLLDEGGTATTRGAITYSLGRIAEARGELGRAKAYYERSLVLRPGNAAVSERLAGL